MDNDRRFDDPDGVPLVDPDGRHWRRGVLATLVGAQQPHPIAAISTRPGGGLRVPGGCYTDRDSLDILLAWVRCLHASDRIDPAVRLTVEHDDGVPVGVLFDPTDPVHHWAVLRHGGFLVLLGSTLTVLHDVAARSGRPTPARRPEISTPPRPPCLTNAPRGRPATVCDDTP